MFVVQKLNYRPWPVTVTRLVCDSSGKVESVSASFVGHFKPISAEDFQALLDKHNAGAEDGLPEGHFGRMGANLRRNAEVLAEVVCGWGPEVVCEGGEPLPFSKDALTALVTGDDGLAVSNAFSVAIFQMVSGVAPEKNFVTSPAPGHPSADEVDATNSPTI